MYIDINVTDNKSGNWAISTFTVSQQDADLFNLRSMFSFSNQGCSIEPGIYKRLTHKDDVIMSNTPNEIDGHLVFIREAKRSGGDVLINGLGLGVGLKAILESPKVESVTIIENSSDVIALVASVYEQDSRVTIIHADAFSWQSPKNMRYNIVWHDIWPNICADNLPEMTKLHRKYGKKTNWQDSWGKNQCKRLLTKDL